MKLYYSPGSCSLSPHIVAEEAGIPLQLEKVDLMAKRTETGRDFWQINPKGYVPALELDDGQLLTEGAVIVQYLADLKPELGLAPANGTLARYRLQEMLVYINSELHKSFSPLFKPDTDEATRAGLKDHLRRRFALLEGVLAKQPYLLGENFTVADAYLFTVASWARMAKVDLSDFPALGEFQKRVAERPAVRKVLQAEGLLQ
ncbi:MAG: glutathione transferase GstA [Azovibrio sp.]|uniref:glutathione transferase GstA n=1 Tax=Azovibrio sp. TaxID=1872673 RepID=UPI003C77FC86